MLLSLLLACSVKGVGHAYVLVGFVYVVVFYCACGFDCRVCVGRMFFCICMCAGQCGMCMWVLMSLCVAHFAQALFFPSRVLCYDECCSPAALPGS